MITSLTLFFFLLIAGLLMICVEIFIPGGVMGALGSMALTGAIVMAFYAFGPVTGMYILVSTIIVLCVCVVLWIKYFPKTFVGRSLTLSIDGKDFKSSGVKSELIDKDGVTLTELRPAGEILVDGVKHDVVSDGAFVEKGSKVRVIKVSGNRIVVRQLERSELEGDKGGQES